VGLLDEDLLLAIHEATVDSGLMLDRPALLAGISPGVYGLWPHVGGPSAQALVDLRQMNREKPMADGSYPLRTWLKNAYALAGRTAWGTLFLEGSVALERVLAAGAAGKAAAIDLPGPLAAWKQDAVRKLVAGRLQARAAQLGATTNARALVKAAADG